MKNKLSFWCRSACMLLLAALALLSISYCAFLPQTAGVKLPVLMLHHIDEKADADTTITPAHFKEVISTLVTQGYESVTVDQVIRYVDEGIPLPEKPVLITFDDGYESVVLHGAPVLRAQGMEAAAFVIGVSVGKDIYKDTGIPITPHFSWEQAREAADVLSVQSHTFDMHQVSTLDTSEYRIGVLKRKWERRGEYEDALRADFTKSLFEIEREVGRPTLAFAYPYGKKTNESEAVLRSVGVRMTLTTVFGVNTIVSGDHESLFSLKRINVTETMSPDDLITAMQS